MSDSERSVERVTKSWTGIGVAGNNGPIWNSDEVKSLIQLYCGFGWNLVECQVKDDRLVRLTFTYDSAT